MLDEARTFDLFTAEAGEGDPVVVLHMGPGLDHTYLRPFLDPLSEQCRLIYCDFRGNGRSPEPATWDGVTHDDWVEDVESLRRSFGLERMCLFGHSYGGYIAMEYALKYPQHAHGIILSGAAPAADSAEESFAIAQAKATPMQLQRLIDDFSAPGSNDPDAFARMFEAILPLYFHSITPDFDVLFGNTVFRPAAFNHMFFNCRPYFDIVERVGEISAPVLILHGRHDWIAPVESSAIRLNRLLRNSELVVFDESGHFPFIEEHDAFLAAVRGWLEVHPEQGDGSPIEEDQYLR